MKSAFFGVAAVAALALATGTASANPPGHHHHHHGGPVIVRSAPLYVAPPVIVSPRPLYGYNYGYNSGSSFSFGVTRPGFSLGFSTGPTYNSYRSYAAPLYSYPSYGYRGFGWGW